MLRQVRVLFVNKRVLLFFSFLSILSVRAQIPSIACPNYFQYFMENSRYMGRISLPNVKPGVTQLEVHLSQPGVVPTPNPSRLSLYDDQATTVNKVLAAQPISYRVEFPMPHTLPKLTLISLNGQVLCADQDYPPPSSKLKLTHTLEMSTLSRIVPFSVRDGGSNAPIVNAPNGNTDYANNPFMPKQRPQQQRPQQQQPTYANTNFFNPFANFGYTTAGSSGDNNAAAPTSTPPLPIRSTPSLNEICGRETATFTPLIRGGSQLQRGQFPWLTAIYRKKGTDLAFICGGSLLSTRTVISAAHCFKDQNVAASKILLLLGRYNLATISEEGSVYRQVQSLSLHPEYNPKLIPDADIAMLQLQEPVSFTAYISPICLWNLASDVSYIAGYSAFVAGWGATEQGEPVSLIPKKAETRIVDDNSCRNSLQRYQSSTSSRTLCASSQSGEGPCTGDSGGGLMLLQQGRWMLRGIVSAGLTRYGQCTPNENFYFCDVAKHLNWIRSHIVA